MVAVPRFAVPLHVVLALLPVPGLAVAEVTLDALEVAPGVIVYRPDTPIGNPTSVALLGDTRTILLDANLPDVAPRIRDDLKARGAKPVDLVVTSHAHRDHVDGLVFWRGEGADALAPVEQDGALRSSPVLAAARAAGQPAFPTLFVEDGARTSLVMGGEDVDVLVLRPPHRSSHTGGDLFVHVPARGVLYVGDHFFLGRYPIVDVDSGGDMDGYLANLDWVAGAFGPETIVVPGHNTFAPAPIAAPRPADLREWTARLRGSRARVLDQRATGVELDAAVAAGLGEDFADLAEKPRFVSEERWIRGVWETARDLVDPSTLPGEDLFDFLEGTWTYAFAGGKGVARYEIEPASGALRESVRGEIGPRSFSGGSLKWRNPESGEWSERWIDSLGNLLEGQPRVEDYAESRLPAVVSQFEHSGALLRHVWYDLAADRFETDLLASADGGATWAVVRRMAYLRVEGAEFDGR